MCISVLFRSSQLIMTIVNSITAIPLAFQDGMRFRQSKFYCLLMTPPILACLVSIIGCTSTKSGPADTKSYSASHRSLFENIPGNDSAYQASEAKTYANQNDKLVQKSSGLRSNASEKADGFSDASWRRGLTNQDSAHALDRWLDERWLDERWLDERR